jgi:(E)-4-hydroxy-3-methylbut-2-enyl-diphosphate synthase
VKLGGQNPIRIQSMTNTDTMDTAGTVEQVTKLAEAGCEIVRVTAPSIRDAENLREIRRRLMERRIDVPLVADIHFTPNAAMIAAELVEKVRINPGNYADKKKFEVREYDEPQYAEEVARVADRFRPLVLRCQANGTAMRIGTNHGSLSDRIMNRFGDTALGMVESALEFLDVCEAESFYDVVFSMKSSNTQVAITAYRLLARRLEERKPGEASYPFHVGVTEAGSAEDGRIKSAIGIGSLLEDGLGDTIRVSLTEDPVREVPVARGIADRAGRDLKDGLREGLRESPKERPQKGLEQASSISSDESLEIDATPLDLALEPSRRSSMAMNWAGLEIGGGAPVRVELEIADALARPVEVAARIATELAALHDVECESLLIACTGSAEFSRLIEFHRELESLGQRLPISLRIDLADEEVLDGATLPAEMSLGRWVGRIDVSTQSSRILRFAEAARKARVLIEWELAGQDHEIPGLVRVALANMGGHSSDCAMSLVPTASLHAVRILAATLADQQASTLPIVLRQRIDSVPASSSVPSLADSPGTSIPDAALIDASVRLGSLLCDGIGDVVSVQSGIDVALAVDLTYRILQGARQRTTRTEYISCPSCGRTLFDLEETTARIQARTDHLPGLKIAVMGCIVNGPGEMADADFGYVGSGVGQVTLYVGKDVVVRAVPEAQATDRLVELIRESGRWVDPVVEPEA